MIKLLQAAKSLNLPDWWICAGFVRSKIWDTIHDFSERTAIPDVDVIYFDKENMDEFEEKKLEEILRRIVPHVPWSVKNEVRMHVVNGLDPYINSVDAISKFPETATALGLRLNQKNNVVLTAPHGVEDVLNLHLRPTPFFMENPNLVQIFENRIAKKNWKGIWPKIKVRHINREDKEKWHEGE
ncbi:nucleotidyltransferase family protein [Salirhabdus euzebyi]|nr:nucleotidyltransferase family protein [Salirhabdus euzebyi]